jgi:YggT family protein
MQILREGLSGILVFLEIAIFIRVILSWVRLPDGNQFVRVVYQVTEPILAPIRTLLDRVLPSDRGMPIDFSPIVALLLIQFLIRIV